MPFKIEINGRAVKGFIDRLERTRDGDYVVIDFKTGSKSENGNSIKENIQMNVYALAVLKKYSKLPARASLYYIKSNETVDYAPDNTWIDVQRERLEEMIQAVLEEKFAAAASYDCRWCDYEGRRVDHDTVVHARRRLDFADDLALDVGLVCVHRDAVLLRERFNARQQRLVILLSVKLGLPRAQHVDVRPVDDQQLHF
jgi:hypothetical protein